MLVDKLKSPNFIACLTDLFLLKSELNQGSMPQFECVIVLWNRLMIIWPISVAAAEAGSSPVVPAGTRKTQIHPGVATKIQKIVHDKYAP